MYARRGGKSPAFQKSTTPFEQQLDELCAKHKKALTDDGVAPEEAQQLVNETRLDLQAELLVKFTQNLTKLKKERLKNKDHISPSSPSK